MKKILLAFVFVLSLAGCSYLGNQIDNIKACWKNSDCRTEALDKSKEVGETAGDLGGMTGLPWASTVSKAVGTFGAALVFLMSGGAALNKKESEPSTPSN